MIIRPYQGNDESDLLDVWHRALPADRISPSLFRTQVLLDPNFHPDYVPVAVEDGRVVGFILCLVRQVPYFLQGMDPSEAWISAFAVHPDYRRRGIGSALFNVIIDKLCAEDRSLVDISPYVPNYFVPGIDTRAYPDTIRFLQERIGFHTLYHAISMGNDLTDFRIPDEIQNRIERAEADDGLTIRPIQATDIPDLMPFLVEHFGWDWFRHAQSYLLEYFGDSSPSHLLPRRARKRRDRRLLPTTKRTLRSFRRPARLPQPGHRTHAAFQMSRDDGGEARLLRLFPLDGRKRRPPLCSRGLQTPPRIRRDAQVTESMM